MTTNVDTPAGHSAPSGGGSKPKSGRSRIFNARLAEASLLPIAFVLVIAGFGIARPDTFFQWSNFTSIFGLNAVNLVLVTADATVRAELPAGGQVFALFVITVAAAEIGIGLAIVILIYRNRETINVDEINLLKW